MNVSQADRSGSILRPEDVAERQRDALHQYATWSRFHFGPRRSGQPLLKNLARYPNCVLVAGCQRSGTTLLTSVIAGARGFQRFALTPDDELDAALILAGAVDVPVDRRYCFQTVYLNDRYGEYRTLAEDQKLIWVLRNPYSVVYSMVYHWRRGRGALNRLYETCGIQKATSGRLRRSHWPWPIGPSRLEKACLSYSAKTSQIELLRVMLPPRQLLIVEYDMIVAAPSVWLPRIFAFIEEPYVDSYAAAVHGNSVRRADRLSDEARRVIQRHSEPVYLRCLSLVSGRPAT